MKVVFDCNVLISSVLFSNSTPGKSFEKATTQHQIILSSDTYQEIKNTLNKKKISKYVSLKDKLVFLNRLFEISTFIEIDHKIVACRDPKDNKYLELAVSGKADCIVTGDNDLLILHPFRGISIITPQDFLVI